MDRHAQRKAQTRATLIAAARAIIIEKGYDTTEILDITERANLSKATFYMHFPNKEECVRSMMLEGFDALVEHVFAQRQTAESAETWAIASLADTFTWAAENRELLLIMVGGAASTKLNAFGRQYMAQISTRLITEYGPPDEFGPHPIEIMAQTVTGLVIQFLGWWLETPNTYSAQHMAELILQLLHNGLGPVRS